MSTQEEPRRPRRRRPKGGLSHWMECSCCDPRRPVYYQAQGRLSVPRHQDDHTTAEVTR